MREMSGRQWIITYLEMANRVNAAILKCMHRAHNLFVERSQNHYVLCCYHAENKEGSQFQL